mmetsp:Transcript_50861/g.99485  ORF Transcript_50861/g.99485 Transcript_50861/m.99485 type:complete len:819 (+) Transcript_50861:86-2542(+)
MIVPRPRWFVLAILSTVAATTSIDIPRSTVSVRRTGTTIASPVGGPEGFEGGIFKRQLSLEAGFTKKGESIYGTTKQYLGIRFATNRNGDRMVVSLRNPGQTKILEYKGGLWSQLGSNIIEQGYIHGGPVAMNHIGDRIIEGNSDMSRARVYELKKTESEEVWTQLGSDIDSSIVGRVFQLGHAVCMNGSGSRVAVLDGMDSTLPENLQKVHVLEYNGSSWEILGDSILANYDGKAKAIFWAAMNNVGDRIVISDSYYKGGANYNESPQGRLHVYSYSGDSWTRLATIVGKPAWQNEFFGSHVQMNDLGDRIVAGAASFGGGLSNKGTFRAFKIHSKDNYEQLGKDKIFTDEWALWGKTSLNGAGDRLVAWSEKRYLDSIIQEVHVYDYKDGDWVMVWELTQPQWPSSPASNGGSAVTIATAPNAFISGNGERIFVSFWIDSTNGKDGGAIHMYAVPVLSNEPSTKPSTSPSAKTSLTPSSLFAGQNFTIGKPQSRFNNNLGNFSVPLNYVEVGHSIDFLNITLRKTGCEKPVTDPVIKMNKSIFLKTDFATPSVLIDTSKFSASPLVVNKSQGESIGVLKFCVRAEGYDGDSEGDNVSISFRHDEISVGYDLTSNTFKVEDNDILADDILLSENNITASYSVDAFRCNTSFEADDISAVLKQDDIVYVCIKPANTSVYISDFNMAFWQDDTEKYTAVSIGVIVNPLSQLSAGGFDGKTKRVASRVISRFFDGVDTSFVIKGNAFLSFSSTDSRRLRSNQDSSQAGKGTFEMEVGLEKRISSTTKTGLFITKEGAVLYVIGGIVALSLGMVVFKKMRA